MVILVCVWEHELVAVGVRYCTLLCPLLEHLDKLSTLPYILFVPGVTSRPEIVTCLQPRLLNATAF